MDFNVLETQIILKIIDCDLVDFLEKILETRKMSDDNLQRFIERSIFRKGKGAHYTRYGFKNKRLFYEKSMYTIYYYN